MPPSRVLHVTESWRPVVSGYTSRSWHIVERQAALGIARPKVLVSSRQRTYGHADVTPMTGRASPGQATDVEVIDCRPSARERYARRIRPFDLDRRALTRAIVKAAAGCDLIHVHWSSGIGQAAADAAHRLALPLVAEVRFDLAGAMASETLAGRATMLEPRLRRRFERHLKRATHVVAASHSLGHLIEQSFPATEGKVSIVLNGVEPPRPSDGQAVRKRLRLTDRVVIGSTSKMLRYENLAAILEAVAHSKGLHALLVGDGPERPALERRARELRAPVTFTGWVSPADLPDYLAAMDIFAVPRRDVSVTRYAAPLKMVEAMAAGCAVIGSQVGDVPRLLGDGRGVLIEPDNRQALSAAIHALAEDHAQRTALGQRAASWAATCSRWDTMVRRYAPIYRGVVR